MQQDECLLVYVTTPDRATAEQIGAVLVSERLAACVNIVDNADSLFRWQGEIQNSKECVCILKTVRGRYPALEKRVTGMHPYELPCIVALPIVAGTAGFLDWIRDETTPAVMA